MSEEEEMTKYLRSLIKSKGLSAVIINTETPNEQMLDIQLTPPEYNQLLREISSSNEVNQNKHHDLKLAYNSINIAAGASRTGKTMMIKLIVYAALTRQMVKWDKIVVIQADATNSWDGFKTMIESKFKLPVLIHNYVDTVHVFNEILNNKRQRTAAAEAINKMLYKIDQNDSYVLSAEEMAIIENTGRKYNNIWNIMKDIPRICIIIDDMSSNTNFFQLSIMKQLPTTISHMFSTLFLILHYFTMNNKLRSAAKVLYLFKGITSTDLKYIYDAYKHTSHLGTKREFEDIYTAETANKYSYIMLS